MLDDISTLLFIEEKSDGTYTFLSADIATKTLEEFLAAASEY